jgi:hypothetical protein
MMPYTDALGSFSEGLLSRGGKAGANLDFFLRMGPILMNASGIGTMINARHPSNVPAHCTPRLLNICFENNGNAAPTADRMIVLAANTDAALEMWLVVCISVKPYWRLTR